MIVFFLPQKLRSIHHDEGKHCREESQNKQNVFGHGTFEIL